MPAITEGIYQPQPVTAGMPGSSLYPNLEELGDYMGLALNSDEVQRNMALVPVADNVSILVHLKTFGWFIIGIILLSLYSLFYRRTEMGQIALETHTKLLLSLRPAMSSQSTAAL
ncbi:hypothetical protein CHARACLAT_009786 [Characodon lateralis]|uniref:Uncharacterized protein n=1 Tax=Characodon lateralis TaxID=208331 RepID=A0ABU7DZ71_9TELE|nr:hypothetical protein [Characodon lateralis]